MSIGCIGKGGRGLLLIEENCKEEIISIAEYLKTKYPKDQFVDIVKSDEYNQPNMNSIIIWLVIPVVSL